MKKKIVLYGYCGIAKRIIYSLDPSEYSIEGCVDDNPKYIGKSEWGGYEVKPLDSINDFDYDFVIIAPTRHVNTMTNKLKDMKIPESKIVAWNNGCINKLDIRMALMRLCMDVIRDRDVKGNCAELGVYKGEFARFINMFLPDRKLYLFDTFEGFKNQKANDEREMELDKNLLDNFTDTDEHIVLESMPYPEKVEICKGIFPKTTRNIIDNESFAFVSIDCDLYEPTKDGIDYFVPRLSKGGYVFVHDYGGHMWPGVKEAVDEALGKRNDIAMMPIMDDCLSAVLIKV